MQFKRVLICCSFNPKAHDMLIQSVAFARAFSDEIRFCHVGEDSPEIRRKLFFLLEDIDVQTPYPILIRQGQAHQSVCCIAKEIGADLIMAGALAHENTFVGIFGSVARRIVRQADCSVLLLTQNTVQTGVVQIAVNMHYDQMANQLIESTIDIARYFKAKLFVLHEYDYRLRFLHSEESGNQQEQVKDYEDQCKTLEEVRLRDFLQGFNWYGIHPIAISFKGSNGSEVAHISQKYNINLMLMRAPKKKLALLERFFNSPAEVLLQDLPCSMLFYRNTIKTNG